MIEFANVTKKYGGTPAVDHVSLNIPADGIYCLLGRNGAGKTTFMKLTAGHIAAALQDGFDRDFAPETAERFELDLRKKYNSLSFGMKTMLTTILTLANLSKVVLLDEPTQGFDAIMRDRFNALLPESYHARPRVIIVSTHLIDEIAKVTERLIVAVISVFTPIAPLRAAEAWFFALILTRPNAAVQVVACLAPAFGVYALNRPIYANKVI